jgi:hypothetical protein
MNYYDRILGLISEVRVIAKKISTRPKPAVLKPSTGRTNYRNDDEAKIQDALRAMKKMPGYSKPSTRAARERELHRRGKQGERSAGPSL